MIRKFIIILILIVFVGEACKEVYVTDLATNKTALVVDGMITDVPGVYTIKLSNALSFYGSIANPVQGANVYVEDAESNHYQFYESMPGTYDSDPGEFITHYGETYTLIIQTSDNKVYRSSPQVLYPKGSLDTLYSVVKRSTLTTFNGQSEFMNVLGAEFVANINLANDFSPYYRFSNTLLVEYLAQYSNSSSGTAQSPLYCWLKYVPYTALNLSERFSNSTMSQQILGFCPMDTNFYGININPIYARVGPSVVLVGWIKESFQYYVITFKQYHLNSDIYEYYKAVNNQIAANQQLLDPVTVQCIGNISCVTNPTESVLGIFEASSLNIYSYIYSREASGSIVDLERISPIDIETIPASNTTGDSQLPYFWTTFK